MIEPSADRTLEQVRIEMWNLHRKVGSLATEALNLRPTVRLVFVRGPLRGLEGHLDAHFRHFATLDADLIALAPHAVDVSSGPQFQILFGIRDSVRGLLVDTNGVVGSVRNQLDFRGSLIVSGIAIVLSAIGFLVG